MYKKASIEIPSAGREMESPGDIPDPGEEFIREHTAKKLKQFLSEEGVELDRLPHGIDVLTEDIIALRNLGKNNDQVWEDVRNCRYLRGYEPPLMVLPDKSDPSQFVFGKSSKELYNQHLMRIARQVKAAKVRRDAEARAATYTLTHSIDNDALVIDKTQYRAYMKRFM